METEIIPLTVGELKERLAALEAAGTINDTTEVFIDTGWDSLQEVQKDGIEAAQTVTYEIQDPLTKEVFLANALLEKAEKFTIREETERTVLVIKNLM